MSRNTLPAGIAKPNRHPRALRRKRRISQSPQYARASHIPSIRQHQHARPAVQLPEFFGLPSLRCHVHKCPLECGGPPLSRSKRQAKFPVLSNVTATIPTLPHRSFRSFSQNFRFKSSVLRPHSPTSPPLLRHSLPPPPGPTAST